MSIPSAFRLSARRLNRPGLCGTSTIRTLPLARLELTPHAIHLAKIVVGHQVNDSKAPPPKHSEGVKKLCLWRGSSETVAKLTRFMCGRAIKPIRLPRGTTELLRLRHSDYVTCDGPMARRHRVL
jgi:hypothetical protein